LAVSYPLSTHNAGMTVIVAFIEMSLLESLYDSDSPQANGSVLLTRRDGIILARIPFEESIWVPPSCRQVRMGK